jgi:hypothetical protein
MRLGLLSLLLSAALVLPAGAFAAGPSNPLLPNSSSPLSPGLPAPQATTPTTTTPTPATNTTSSSSNGTFSGSTGIMIGIAALAVLFGIAFFIWRDARKRAPVRHRTAALADGPGGRSGSKTRTKPRKLSPAEKRRRKRGRAR